MASNAAEDPNRITWAQYLKEEDDKTSSEEEDDFRGDSLNDADWDGQGRGTAGTGNVTKNWHPGRTSGYRTIRF
jgi:hypothetical protein